MTGDDEQTDVDGVKSSLRRLAGPDDRQIIERATEDVEDLGAAAVFIDRIGLVDLESAVERVDDPELRARGRRALDAFRRFRRAAVGSGSGDHFHSGRGTPLRTDPEGSNQ